MKIFFRVSLLVALSLAFTNPLYSSAQAQEIAREFKLPDLEGKVFTLSAYKDKQPVFLFFWTTWCPYCREGMKELNSSYPELSKKGWVVAAVNLGEPPQKVQGFVDNYALKFNVLLDRYLSVADAYDVLGVPSYVLINKAGIIVFKDNYLPLGKLEELASE